MSDSAANSPFSVPPVSAPPTATELLPQQANLPTQAYPQPEIPVNSPTAIPSPPVTPPPASQFQNQQNLDQAYNVAPTFQQPAASSLPQSSLPNTKPQPEQLLMEWEAPSRPFKQRNRQYYVTIFAIMLLISLILFFAGQFLPIAVVFALGFLAYVSAAVPPEMVVHQITTYGIRTGDQLYYWEELGRFWFEEKYGQALLKIEVARFPSQIMLLLGQQSLDEMKQILSEILLNEKPPLTQFEQAARWLQEKVPLDPEA